MAAQVERCGSLLRASIGSSLPTSSFCGQSERPSDRILPEACIGELTSSQPSLLTQLTQCFLSISSSGESRRSKTSWRPRPSVPILVMGSSMLVTSRACATSIRVRQSTYRIVGVGEADPAAGSISYTSPVGAAMVGRRVGDVIDVEVPSGTRRFKVLGIEP